MVTHLGLPSLLSIAIIALYFTPKASFGCANRGYLAVGVAVLGMLGACVTMGIAVRMKNTDRGRATWWLATALVLLLPALLLLRLA